MTNFTERAVPTITANFLMQEAEARYYFANKHLSTGNTVLDLACGTGYGSQILLKKNDYYIGVDINDEALLFSQAHYASERAAFLKMDVNNLVFKDKAFDSIVAFEMVEHLTNQDRFLKEVSRVLSSKGIFVISTPNRLIQSPNGIPMSPYHTKEYSPVEFETLLKKHFRKVEVFGQIKNKEVLRVVDTFMFSQKVRQFFVDIDVLGIRKLFSRDTKELLWKHFGALAGRNAQERVKSSDFVISKKDPETAEYLIALCTK